MEAPDLAQFRYVPTDNLVGPKFENVAVGDVVEQKEGDRVVVLAKNTAFHELAKNWRLTDV